MVHDKIEHDAILQKHKERVTFQIWDKVSPINNVPKEHWLNRDDIKAVLPDGEIFIVSIDGRVCFVEPSDHFEVGHKQLTKADLDTSDPNSYASRWLTDHASVWAANDVIEEAVSQL